MGGSQILLYAIGLPLAVLLFLRRHRDELDKPVVRFRYGLFFAGFREDKYYWEVVVAMRKESTVILAIFGSQLGVAMLAHVALLVFMVQMLIQLVGNPYDPQRNKLQILDVMSICICWGTMWSGFFFYTPRPPSQKPALEALTMLVVLANALYMLALLYFMCSETCKEHKDNVVLKKIHSRATSMQQTFHHKRVSRQSDTERRATQHFRNPSIEAHMAEIQLAARTEASLQEERTNEEKKKKKKKKGSGSRATAVQKKKKQKSRPEQLGAAGAGIARTDRNKSQEDRKMRLRSLAAKRQSREEVFVMGGASNPLYDKKVIIEMADISTSAEEASGEVKVDVEVEEEGEMVGGGTP